MRLQEWCWRCELCNHTWLAVGIDAPEKCAKCKKRGWHTKNTTNQAVATPSQIHQFNAKQAERPSVIEQLRSTIAVIEAKPAASLVEYGEEETLWPSCYECDRTMSSKHIKGRGVVYACTDLACPMYGLERN